MNAHYCMRTKHLYSLIYLPEISAVYKYFKEMLLLRAIMDGEICIYLRKGTKIYAVLLQVPTFVVY